MNLPDHIETLEQAYILGYEDGFNEATAVVNPPVDEDRFEDGELLSDPPRGIVPDKFALLEIGDIITETVSPRAFYYDPNMKIKGTHWRFKSKTGDGWETTWDEV